MADAPMEFRDTEMAMEAGNGMDEPLAVQLSAAQRACRH